MRRPDPLNIENAEPSNLLVFGALALFVSCGLALLIVAATPMPA